METEWTLERRQRLLEYYMSFIGTAGNLSFYFQAWEIFKQGSAGAVSLTAVAISAIGIAHWLVYGIIMRSQSLIVANAFGLIGALSVLACMFYCR
jgi:MtN3 and saliva related transmembrane protein